MLVEAQEEITMLQQQIATLAPAAASHAAFTPAPAPRPRFQLRTWHVVAAFFMLKLVVAMAGGGH
jgi:hypothetical protein